MHMKHEFNELKSAWTEHDHLETNSLNRKPWIIETLVCSHLGRYCLFYTWLYHWFQQLLSEFDEYKPVLDKLRAKGSDLILHTPDSVEKQVVQRLLADTNRQWLALQAKSFDKSRKLNEAEDLQTKFNETADALARWADGAEFMIGTEPEKTDFDKVKEQLKQHRVRNENKKWHVIEF